MEKQEVTLSHIVADTRSEINGVCTKCQAKILLSGEQLQNQQTYTCPQCGEIHDMEPLRKAVQGASTEKAARVQKYNYQITLQCPKCHVKTSVLDEHVLNSPTFSCPQCGSAIDLEPLKKAMQEADVESGIPGSIPGQRRMDKYFIAGICQKCHTRIPISMEQLDATETYSCPHCGAVQDMAPLRQAIRSKSFYGPGYKDKYDAVYPLSARPLSKFVRLGNAYYISIVAIVVILVVLLAMFLHGIFK